MSKLYKYVIDTRPYTIGGWKKYILQLVESSNLDELTYEQKVDILDEIAIKIKDNCKTLYNVIKKFNVEDKKEEILNYIQGRSPQILCPENPTFKSKRAKVVKNVRAYGKRNITKKSPIGIILNQYIDIPDCFCLTHKSGVYENTFIPVIRYGVNENVGFYGSIRLNNPTYTWYYVEPESEIYLYSPKTLVSINKITAALELFKMTNTEDTKEFIEIVLSRIKEEIGTTMKLNKLEKLILDEERKSLNDKINNRFILNNGELLYGGGSLDYLDSYITEYSKNLGIDVVVLKEQSGNSGRLVSECVDNRPRNISYSNLYYLN
jgi:hypothetical protein